MNLNIQILSSRRAGRATQLSLVLALGLALAGCGSDESAPAATNAPAAAAPAVDAGNAVSAQVAAMTPDQLREAASTAYRENRLYAPGSNNALEYYLALRDKQPGDAAVASALTDLLPMTVIAIEQSVNREDFAEAQRLAALLEKADPQHPAVARLKTSIATQQVAVAKRAEEQKLTAEQEALKQAELEKQRLADQQRLQQEAAKQLASQQGAQAQQQAADRRAAEQRASEQQAAEQRAAEQRVAEQRAAEQRAAQARTAAAAPAASSAASELRALSTPAPRFPAEALRAGQSGEVQVEFTVAPDGSVSNARVVRAQPARVFDREAVNAVKRWRFQPVDAPVTTRRTIAFDPGA
ncbi:energy transducer TonB [Cognatilysobacter bugurensis]|uniref:Protein TonB n=1 Tax=Cognatilysobacter bugurensis TaxID=543356 RepID=A0A918W9X5_9GAMM|nr:energy transducer TonB [Lysobacter bugurensis]GHA86895.1 cell envelope biogenesis protein TonB [Lysobacter bugurensis]